MSDDGREVGGSPELELRQALLVGSNHSLDAWCQVAAGGSGASLTASIRRRAEVAGAIRLTVTEGVCWVEVDRKFVGHL